jgi:hypothetical protein
VTDEYAAGQTPRLVDVLAALSAEDRRALLRHVEAGRDHALLIGEWLQATEASEPLTRRQVEIHLLAAICHLELAAGTLGCDPGTAAPRRPWWLRWLWPWGREPGR